MVQSAHAALEAGKKFPYPTSEPSSLVMLQVACRDTLMDALERVKQLGFNTELFFEPDWDYGHTAFATEPILDTERHALKEFKTWKP